MYSPLNLPSTRFPAASSDWPGGAYKRSWFGQDFLWHSVAHGGRHLDEQLLAVYRQEGDPELDSILEQLEIERRPLRAYDDLLEIAELATSKSSPTDRRLSEWLQRYSRVPNWVDIEQLKRGVDVFLAYTPAVSFALYYRSLVPGFSIPVLTEVLLSTGYLAPPSSRQRTRERLIDTGALLASCFSGDVNTLLPGERGWQACLRVRCLHAKVRRGLLKRTGSRRWDLERLGVPICHEDLVATLLAFSTNALLGIEMIIGFALPLEERKDFMALWRYLGWLLGVPVLENSQQEGKPENQPLDPCGPGWIEESPDCVAHSYAVFQSIIVHILQPNDKSVSVAHHLLRQGRIKDPDEKTQREAENWFYYRALQCRRFVGDPLADALRLPLRETFFGRALKLFYSTCVLWFVTLYTILALPRSPLRPLIVHFHKRQIARFLEKWTAEHSKRVSSHAKTDTACPFAMIAPPIY